MPRQAGWFGGEILGFIVGVLAKAGGAAYFLALVGAVVGTYIAYAIVKRPPNQVALGSEIPIVRP